MAVAVHSGAAGTTGGIMRPLILAFAIALSAASPAPAHDVTKDGIMVVHPMARPVIEGRPGVIYMAIANDGDEDDRLLGARSPAFEAVEMHESYEEDGVMKMRLVETLEIPAGDTALLEPGGIHMMLLGAKQSIAAGEEFPLVLIFEGAGEIEVPVTVDPMPGAAASSAHGQHAAPTQ
jgi:copper(I)-binding protein